MLWILIAMVAEVPTTHTNGNDKILVRARVETMLLHLWRLFVSTCCECRRRCAIICVVDVAL